MALELKDIKPDIMCGIQYKESPEFLDMRHHLKEYLEELLKKISKDKKGRYGAKIDDTGDILGAVSIKDHGDLIIGIANNSFSFVITDL